jgi:TRAP-type C4-dicarboxylate transport system substrate-binding protein
MNTLSRTLLLAAFAAAVATQPASAQTKWNLPAAYPADNPHSENLALFAKDVAAATGDKLQPGADR